MARKSLKKKRVDQLMVERQLAPSREKAQALILAGKVLADNMPVVKPGKVVEVAANLRLLEKDHPYVSRGGIKLESALKDLNFSATDLTAMDVGASTGGFTHCLLLNGTKKVYAIDVGYGQLAWLLRQDERVVSLERTNIRHLEFDQIGEEVDLVVIDASFISLKIVFPSVIAFLKPGGHIISLVKPQFEAGRSDVGKRGLVDDEAVYERIQKEISESAESHGLKVLQWIESSILGKKSGNKEFFVFLYKVSP